MCSPESYLGVDIDQESLQIARRRRPHFCFASEATGHKHFDTIVALALLEHVPDPCSTLQELRSCGGPGCRIVLTVPHPSYYWLHAMLSHIGILSRNAHEEHQQAIDEDLIGILARETGMRIVEYRRFLMGANQLLVLEPNASSGDEVVE